MEHMQEAYEELVGKLKRKIDKLEDRYQRQVEEDVTVRNILIQKIVDLSSKAEALATAKEIDEAIGRPGDYATLVECRDWE
jgi:type III secretory pathway component EscV